MIKIWAVWVWLLMMFASFFLFAGCAFYAPRCRGCGYGSSDFKVTTCEIG